MNKQTYSINQICEDVADSLRQFKLDIPMISQAINDHCDAMDKSGFKVNLNFSQDAAVKRVCKSLANRR